MTLAFTANAPQSWAATPARADIRQRLVMPVLIAALTFNFVLCFVNTTAVHVGASVVMLAEVLLLGCTFLLVADRSPAMHAILLGIVSYLGALMLMRGVADPKILRDLLIPVVFYMLGRTRGSVELGDRVVTWSVAIVLAVSLFEWAFLDTFLKFFDVLGYYVSRGTVDAASAGHGSGLFISGTRFEGRTLLPFLGEHRVSSVFLEPVSMGNFGAITFAWVLSRDLKRPLVFMAKTLAIMTILVLGDARFGMYICIITLGLYCVAPFVRPVMIYVAPFLAIIAIVSYTTMKGHVAWDNTIWGRFLLAGQMIGTLDAQQIFGLVWTTTDYNDSGYAYVMAQLGIVGFAALWAVFVFLPVPDGQPRRFTLFVAFYVILLLCISVSLCTIKTAALAWFLAGICGRPALAAAAQRFSEGWPSMGRAALR
jgi:putative polymerase